MRVLITETFTFPIDLFNINDDSLFDFNSNNAGIVVNYFYIPLDKSYKVETLVPTYDDTDSFLTLKFKTNNDRFRKIILGKRKKK